MKEQITAELFDHLVGLAALELDPEEAEYLRQQLNNQLTAIHELEAIPIDEGIPLTSHGVPYTPEITPPIREDDRDVGSGSGVADAILAGAPETDGRYIVVPDIPHTELE
jgi:aspartyl-tRNA(Asn)/glutamyl-tRNA(Gln) amidotransferase subunit C